ncbi:hypothetical protein [Desertivirga arenae]|uniref:hypothetical protein n=1 Tax=Desertivirga arenae TaxID=2810309 RepID=UPI001A96FD14|nr:hypothetical protein [Pedobacter sp. SYSU D00823]
MKRLRALSLVFPILGLTAVTANAQSKKEVIEKMTVQVDSLQKDLARKTANIHELEVKVAKLEGSMEVSGGLVKRLEAKSDSLTLKLISKTNSVDSLNSEIKKLNATIGELKSSGDTLLANNEALKKEIELAKEKVPAKALPVENKPLTAETAKPEVAVKKD